MKRTVSNVSGKAPRRFLSSKTHKLPEQAAKDITAALAAIKKKNLSKVLSLSQQALEALLELEKIEAQMDEEAREIHEDYPNVIRDFKLTYTRAYQEHLDECDSDEPSIEQCRFFVQGMSEEAEEMTAAGEA
jgi:hypothetical protein